MFDTLPLYYNVIFQLMKASHQLKHLEKNIDKNSECHHFESKSNVRVNEQKNVQLFLQYCCQNKLNSDDESVLPPTNYLQQIKLFQMAVSCCRK